MALSLRHASNIKTRDADANRCRDSDGAENAVVVWLDRSKGKNSTACRPSGGGSFVSQTPHSQGRSKISRL
jgi:hypothetical protein